MKNFNVVIALQNWTFHNFNGDISKWNVVVIAPQKSDLPQLRGSMVMQRSRCNSPSKSDLPQP